MSIEVEFVLNGRATRVVVAPDRILVDLLREDLGLLGTKAGCRIGYCGACTVLCDGAPVHGCSVLVLQVDGRRVDTIESAHPSVEAARRAFVDEGAGQCGYCIPGFVMTVASTARPSGRRGGAGVEELCSGVLCRCGSYAGVLRAAERARPRDGDGGA